MKDRDKALDAARMMLEAIEGTPIQPYLQETPIRFVKALEEILDGYSVDIPALFKTFDGEGKEQLVVVRNIETYSICRHHLLPFFVQASVGYLPNDRVIGVSKIARVVHMYAHRLQLQEGLTEQIAVCLKDNLKPLGVGVVIRGEHLCMRMRGIRSTESQVFTSVMLGAFREQESLKAEFLSLIGG